MVVNKTYPEGIDCSNNNGAINWAAVARSGIQFAIHKASEGTSFVDSFFFRNVVGCRENGILTGYYHFGRPSRNGAVAEADFFVDTFSRQLAIEPGELVALDLEDDQAGGDLSTWTLQWLDRVTSRVGFRPLLYTSPGYAQAHGLANQPGLGQYGLWLASWGVPTPPPAPAPWEFTAIHQYGVTGAGSVPGVSGECDRNRFNGPIERLPLYGMPAPIEPPPLPPLPPVPTLAEVRAELVRISGLSDQEIAVLWMRGQIAALVDRIPDTV